MKDEILEIARKMFLEKTFDEVVMRDIAKKLDISVGNLTYHFKKKEDLLEAVVIDMFSRYKPQLPYKTLEELDAWITVLEKKGTEDTFYFKDFARLAQLGQKVQHIQKEVFKGNMQFWHRTLETFCKSGLIQQEGFDGQHEAFIHNFYLIKARWSEQNLIEVGLGAHKTGLRFRVWALIFPMLTEKGRQVFKKKIIL